MIVGLFYTKKTPRGNKLINYFGAGVIESGDKTLPLHSERDLGKIRKCDVVLMHGWVVWNPIDGSKIAIRKEIWTQCQRYKKRILVIDTSFFGNWQEYVSIGYDGIKRDGFYYNQNSPSDRFDQLQLPLKKRPHGDSVESPRYILLVGQNRFGISCQTLDTFQFHIETSRKCHDLTGKQVIFRPHPRCKYPQSDDDFYQVAQIDKTSSLQDLFQKVSAVVGYSSNALNESVVAGIPTVTLSEAATAWPVAGHTLDDLLAPPMPAREQWAYDLAYAQWNWQEMREGLPWKHLRPYVSDYKK